MKRAPKPRIAKPNLTWKWIPTKAAWEPFYRVSWTEGGKRKERTIRLDWQGDAARLDQQYWAARSGKLAKQRAESQYTWGDLVRAWRSDPRVQSNLAASTKRSYARHMEAILEKNAAKDVRRTTRQGVRAIHEKLADEPRRADWYVQIVSRLWNYAKNERDWPLGENPAAGITLYGKQREYEPWPEWMVDRLSEAPAAVQMAAQLILGTGQRPNAAITMTWDQFDGEWMRLTDEKGDEQFEVFCPVALRDFLADQPKRGRHLLPKNLSASVGYHAIEKTFRAWRATLGDEARPYTLHGLRKLAIVRLAEAGCTDAEIQAITNQSMQTIAYYRRRASRRVLSRNAQNRRRQNKNKT